MFGHWFVVASQKTVKIFTEVSDKKSVRKELKQLKTFDNPLGREKTRALIRKEAGRGLKSMGRNGVVRYSETKRHDPHEEAALQFAKKMARILEIERQQKNFASLTIVAEPHFLGMIRAAMDPKLKKLVTSWLCKDLQKTPKQELLQFLIPPAIPKMA